LVTKANMADYYAILDRMEAKMRPTPAPKP
jgi:hypothetical protein